MRRVGVSRPLLIALVAALIPCAQAQADPWDQPVPPKPVFVVQPSSWVPKFPNPYDATQKDVTDRDIAALGEMCQWFQADYKELERQIDTFGHNLHEANNDWTVGLIQAQADAITANIDQVMAFLAPRAESLTQTQDYAGDNYFPVYQGESFYRLWQHLSNVGVGIKARNTSWVFGPSVQRERHWASRIYRSHVCD